MRNKNNVMIAVVAVVVMMMVLAFGMVIGGKATQKKSLGIEAAEALVLAPS